MTYKPFVFGVLKRSQLKRIKERMRIILILAVRGGLICQFFAFVSTTEQSCSLDIVVLLII